MRQPFFHSTCEGVNPSSIQLVNASALLCFNLWMRQPFFASTCECVRPSLLQLANASALPCFNLRMRQPFFASTCECVNPSLIQVVNASALLCFNLWMRQPFMNASIRLLLRVTFKIDYCSCALNPCWQLEYNYVRLNALRLRGQRLLHVQGDAGHPG
jgi:hypothetical protein